MSCRSKKTFSPITQNVDTHIHTTSNKLVFVSIAKSKMDSTEMGFVLKWNYNMRNGYHTQYFMARYAKYEVKFTLAFSLYPFLPCHIQTV